MCGGQFCVLVNLPCDWGEGPPVPDVPFVSQFNLEEEAAQEPAETAEGYESAQSTSTDSVPELEPDDDGETSNVQPDVIDEVGNVDPNDPLPFGEPSESSEEEGPSSSTAPPPPRRSSRAGASRPAGFYSEANQAARGEGGNFFFQRLVRMCPFTIRPILDLLAAENVSQGMLAHTTSKSPGIQTNL